MNSDHHTAIGDMLRDSWRKGRRTGFFEGAIVGALFGMAIVVIRAWS